MIGKMSVPATSWSNSACVSRSAESLWKASKLSQNPRLFIPNCLRPVASVLAKHAPRERQSALKDYAATYFTSLEDVDRLISFRGLSSASIDENRLKTLRLTDSPIGESSRIILALKNAGEGYIEPNIALISKEPTSIGRGDTELINNHKKWLASLAIGEQALTSLNQQTIPATSTVAA